MENQGSRLLQIFGCRKGLCNRVSQRPGKEAICIGLKEEEKRSSKFQGLAEETGFLFRDDAVA